MHNLLRNSSIRIISQAMPIDYSKFDNIGSDDEDDVKDPKDNLAEVMQQCLREIGERSARGEKVPSGAGFGDSLFPYADPGFALDPGCPDPFADDIDFGLGEGGSNSRALDFAELRDEAFKLLLNRLVCRPDAANVARALLLESELDLLACRYHQALVGAEALKLATTRGSSFTPLKSATQRINLCPVSGVAEEWAAPAMVIEMVASYQLGDREHAVAVRDQLRVMPKESLSQHLQKRFDGTSEILELVPQFLSLLKTADRQPQLEQR